MALTPARLAGLFALLGTLAALLFATLVPPYQNPDEPAHFERADQLANGGLLARRGAYAPALIDEGIDADVRTFWAVPAYNHMHVNRSMYAPVGWGGRQVDGPPNTAVYPPNFYIPAALAIRAGKRAGLTILPTLELARGAQGAASVLIGTLAIAIGGPAAVWLFAVLSLPMSLSQMAACGQDGPMIACTALAVALALRVQVASGATAWRVLLPLCFCLALVGMARPPYAAFALLILLAGAIGWRLRVLAVGCVLAVIGCWCWVSLHVSGLDPGHFNGSDAQLQTLQLAHAPLRVFAIAWNTARFFGRGYAEQFIGKLGWLNVSLPFWFRGLAGVILIAGAVLARRAGQGRRAPHALWIVLAAVLLSVISMFALQYLTWTRVGDGSVQGMQGRYFLAPALVAGLFLSRPIASGSRFAGIGAWIVALFPMVTIVVCVHAILLRYYL